MFTLKKNAKQLVKYTFVAPVFIFAVSLLL